MSRITSTPPFALATSAKSWVVTSTLMSAPSFSASAALAAPRPVAITLAPAALAIWIAVVPIPDVAPWIITVSPGCRLPCSNTLANTVNTVSGRAAASSRLRPCGIGKAWRASQTAYSA